MFPFISTKSCHEFIHPVKILRYIPRYSETDIFFHMILIYGFKFLHLMPLDIFQSWLQCKSSIVVFFMAIMAKLATITAKTPQKWALRYIVTFRQIQFFSCMCLY